MSLTNGQKQALHSAARNAGVGEEDRRLIQRNLGGFYSAADRTASREGFIAVMAFLEHKAGGCLRGGTAGYWTAQTETANPTDRLLYRVNREAANMGWTPEHVDNFLHSPKMSNGLFATVADAPAYWLRKLLEALLAIQRRGGDGRRR